MKWTLIAVAVLGLAGTLNETYVLNGLQTPIA